MNEKLRSAVHTLANGKRVNDPAGWDDAEGTLICACESREVREAFALIALLAKGVSSVLSYAKNPDGDDSVVTGWLDIATGGWDRGEWAEFGGDIATMISYAK